MQCALEAAIYAITLDLPDYNAIREDPRHIPNVLTHQPQRNFTSRVEYSLVQAQNSPEVYAKTCSDLKSAAGQTFYEVLTPTATVRYNDQFVPNFFEEDSLFHNIYLQTVPRDHILPGTPLYSVTVYEIRAIAPESDPLNITRFGGFPA